MGLEDKMGISLEEKEKIDFMIRQLCKLLTSSNNPSAKAIIISDDKRLFTHL